MRVAAAAGIVAAALAALVLAALASTKAIELLVARGGGLPDAAFQALLAIPLLHLPAVAAIAWLASRAWLRAGLRGPGRERHRNELAMVVPAWGALLPSFAAMETHPVSGVGAAVAGIVLAAMTLAAALVVLRIDRTLWPFQAYVIPPGLQLLLSYEEIETWGPAVLAPLIALALCGAWDIGRRMLARRLTPSSAAPPPRRTREPRPSDRRRRSAPSSRKGRAS